MKLVSVVLPPLRHGTVLVLLVPGALVLDPSPGHCSRGAVFKLSFLNVLHFMSSMMGKIVATL